MNDTTKTEAPNEPIMLLSEMVRAFKEKRVEFDIPGVLMFFGEDGCHALCSIEKVKSAHERMVLRMAGVGLPRIVSDAMSSVEVRSMAMLAEAYAMSIAHERKKESVGRLRIDLKELLSALSEDSSEDEGNTEI